MFGWAPLDQIQGNLGILDRIGAEQFRQEPGGQRRENPDTDDTDFAASECLGIDGGMNINI